jgi:hypothetical protein
MAPGTYDLASLAAALTRRGHDVRVLTASRVDAGVASGGYVAIDAEVMYDAAARRAAAISA